eukprot:scaffold3444_cov57-Phaeocystis_antarctica.AAC.7
MDPEPDPWILMCPRLIPSAPDAPGPSTAPRVFYGGAHDRTRRVGLDPWIRDSAWARTRHALRLYRLLAVCLSTKLSDVLVRCVPSHPSRRSLLASSQMALMFLSTVASLVLAPQRAGPALQSRRTSAPAMLDIPRLELPSAVRHACPEEDGGPAASAVNLQLAPTAPNSSHRPATDLG